MDTMPSSDSAAPITQAFSRDKTRLTGKPKPVKPKIHPAAAAAAMSWQKLHGGKFHANAGRFGKK
jgi:hypothetical protein